ncbi:AraC family transcriptional regulator [Lentisphaerota bacterium ZTH]|nr:helix-turn-helix domain-containing protein [Lentisphaerota bacterium]WET06742.1 AraC family transcriptional regulator [Lentisphaerota bacterium ZTH]
MKISTLNLNVELRPGAIQNHCHEFWQLDYYSGIKDRVTAVSDNRHLCLDATCALLLPPYCSHKIVYPSPCTVSSVKFTPDYSPDFKDVKLEAQIIDLADYGDLIKMIFYDDIIEDTTCRQIREHSLSILVLRFLQYSRRRQDNCLPDDRLNESLKYMKQHVNANLKLDDLAQSSGMSINHYIRCFKRVLGMTPMRYMRKLVIRKAAEMLNYADLSLAEIARQLGFPDQHCFSRAFRRETSLPPGTFRRIQREPFQESLKR